MSFYEGLVKAVHPHGATVKHKRDKNAENREWSFGTREVLNSILAEDRSPDLSPDKRGTRRLEILHAALLAYGRVPHYTSTE